jgi:hypothetical protein
MAGTIITDRIESDATYDSKIELVSPVLVSNTFAVKSTGGTGVFNIVGANTNTDRTFTLPNAAGEMVLNSATQTLTNKTIQGGALTLATAVSASGTEVEFKSIPSWVKRITVMFDGVSTNGTSAVQMQLGSSSFTTSGYLAGFSAVSGATVAGQNLTTGVAVQTRADVLNLSTGLINICLLTGSTYVATGTIYNTTYGGFVTTTTSKISLSGALDRLRITTVNGTDTFDAGTINIMYGG